MTAAIERDRYGRPLVQPPGGGRPIPYSRASSFGDVLDDKEGLALWKLRMAVKGLARRPDLLLAASSTPLADKSRLNAIAREAIDAADDRKAASVGTSLHALTEALDRGEDLPLFPEPYKADVAAYGAATSRFEHRHVERFVVCDELQVAGTPDRVFHHTDALPFNGVVLDPATRIGDLKTGGDSRYLGRHAVQLAIYAHSELYDPETGERRPITAPFAGAAGVARDWGVIFHMPAGAGVCDLYAVDLAAGWDGALLAADVRAWRRRKGLAVAA